MGEKIVSATAVIMGVAIGVLTVALGIGLVGSPWELHFAAHRVAAIAVALIGLTAVAVGIVMMVDLLDGPPRHRYQH